MSALGQKRTFGPLAAKPSLPPTRIFVAGDGTSALTQIAVERANDGVIIVTGDRLN